MKKSELKRGRLSTLEKVSLDRSPPNPIQIQNALFDLTPYYSFLPASSTPMKSFPFVPAIGWLSFPLILAWESGPREERLVLAQTCERFILPFLKHRPNSYFSRSSLRSPLAKATFQTKGEIGILLCYGIRTLSTCQPFPQPQGKWVLVKLLGDR